MCSIPGLDYGVLDTLLGYALRRAQNALYLDFHAATASFDISPQRFAALVLISRNPGLHQGLLAEAMGIDRSGGLRLVAWLEKRGLVLRTTQKDDARSWQIHITPHGSDVVAAMSAAVQAHDRAMLDRVGQDGPRLRLLLERLAITVAVEAACNQMPKPKKAKRRTT